MKPRKSKGQIKISPNVKKKLYATVKAERVVFEKVVVYKKEKSPLKAIRNKCLWCCGDSKHEVKMCEITSCVLWEFRFGKNPHITRVFSEEHKEKLEEALDKARLARLEKGQIKSIRRRITPNK